MIIPDYTVSKFLGLNTFIKDLKTLKPGVASSSKNWLTAKFGDHIELRRGSALLGTTRVDGSGKVSGIGVGSRYDAVQVPFFSYEDKVRYYNADDDDTHAVQVPGTNECLTNGGFTGNSSGWTEGAGWAYGTNDEIHTPGNTDLLQQLNVAMDAQHTYILKFTIASRSAGSVSVGFGDGTIQLSAVHINASYYYLVTLGEFNGSTIFFKPSSDFDGHISAVSVIAIEDLVLPVATDDMWFGNYQNLAGSMEYFGSANTGIYKVPLANPSSAVSQAVNSFRFASLRFGQGRSYAGQRNGTTAGNRDKTGAYLSAIDKALLSAFTQTTGETLATGDGSSNSFSGKLAAVTGNKTVMYPSITDTVETFTDDRDGNLTGSLGGSGTINYATGYVSLTFASAPANGQAITASYYTEDATSGGPLDFDTSAPGAGKAKIFRQDDGGGLYMNSLPFMETDYAFHERKTWAIVTTIDDTNATNLVYRAIGIPNPRAAIEEPEGILLVDTSNPNEPKIRRLEIGQNTTNLTIVPTPISDALDLSGYDLSNAIAFRWGDYEIVCVGEYTNDVANGYNSVAFIRNVASGAWDRLDYRASCFAIYNGALIAGDSLSNNVFTLFSGYDDDDAAIDNAWTDGQLNLGTDHLKKTKLMRVTGLIQKDQNIEVYITLDDGSPVLVFTIRGDGTYVDAGINTTIGSYTIGSKLIGGGGEVIAHPFDITFPITTDRYQYIQTTFKATDIGYAAINSYTFKDNRDKGRRSLPTKTV